MDVADRALTSPDQVAIVMSSGERMTYGELVERSNRVAQVLYSAGLRRGDGIVIMVPNGPEFFVISWAAQRSGLYYTPVNIHLQFDEVRYIVEDSGSKALFIDASFGDLARELLQTTPGLELRVVLGGELEGYQGFDDLLAAVPNLGPPEPSHGTEMMYSSGTTGYPKAVRRPLPGPEGSWSQAATLEALRERYGMSEASIYLSPAPLYHSAPFVFTMAGLQLGMTSIVMEHFDPVRTLELIQEYRVTHVQMVPTMFLRMLKLETAVRNRYDISSLKSAIHAAAPCPVEAKRQMLEWWGPIIWEYYAGTEGVGGTIIGPEEWLSHPGSVGRPLSPVHIIGEDGNDLPVGESGAIYFEGGAEFEYHNDPVKTASVRNEKGWRTLGDVGYLDEEGYLYLTDRASFMIVSGGVNIYPQEAENLLLLHPKVMDAAVFGVPNPEYGEEVKAVVKPVAWSEAGPELEGELIEHCRRSLAHYKCPRSIDFLLELPRDPNGKLYKRRLRDSYWQGHDTKLL